jgi:hypothetical protein
MPQSSSSLASRFAVRMSLVCEALSAPHLAEPSTDRADVTGIAPYATDQSALRCALALVSAKFRSQSEKNVGLAEVNYKGM